MVGTGLDCHLVFCRIPRLSVQKLKWCSIPINFSKALNIISKKRTEEKFFFNPSGEPAGITRTRNHARRPS